MSPMKLDRIASESILNSEPLCCCSNTNIGLLKCGLRRAPERRPKRQRKYRVPPSAGTSISSRRHSTCGTPTRVGGTENHGLGLAAAMRPQQMHDVMGRGGHCIVRYPPQSIDVQEI